MTRTIDIIEVGPRDGFQNLPSFIHTEEKIRIISSLIDCGVKHLQITSFVSPKAIPQMRDAKEVVDAILSMEKAKDLDLFALVPNLYGARAAVEAGLKKITTVISLSKSHNQANIRRTHDESFEELAAMMRELEGVEITLDVATTFGCPFEGKYTDTAPLLAFLQRAYDLGVRTFNLCDTIGIADPAQVRNVGTEVKKAFPDVRIEVHVHDTYGLGVVNSLAGIEAGADGVQSTLGGLGGCPFAPGASGNTATEDLNRMLQHMGYDTGIDSDALVELAKSLYKNVPDGNFSGHLLHIDAHPTCVV